MGKILELQSLLGLYPIKLENIKKTRWSGRFYRFSPLEETWFKKEILFFTFIGYVVFPIELIINIFYNLLKLFLEYYYMR